MSTLGKETLGQQLQISRETSAGETDNILFEAFPKGTSSGYVNSESVVDC